MDHTNKHMNTHTIKTVKYHTPATRWIHWSMAVAIIFMLFIGMFMTDSLSRWQPYAVWLHISVGITLLIFACIRLANRFKAPQPKLPKQLNAAQAKMAHLSHVLLYVFMFMMPLTGYLMVNADGRPISFFGLVYLPTLIDQNIVAYGLLRTLHGWVSYTFAGLIILHIVAALYHGLIRQDRVLASMLFSKKMKRREIDTFLEDTSANSDKS